MKQNVKIVFDRKKQSATRGTGKIELYIYLSSTIWERGRGRPRSQANQTNNF